MKRLLITGAAGHVGQALLAQLDVDRFAVTACDIQPMANVSDKVEFQRMDVCDREAVSRIIETSRPDVVIHLASIVTPPKGTGRDFAYDVDVNGTRHVLDACLDHGVGRLVVTSSGAAYGYHPENASMLKEEDPIRGNREFAYSYHKRLVEEMLAETRKDHPELEQVILRVGTILGDGLENQITALFHKNRLLGLRNNESPFVFIWDTDLACILLRACDGGEPGIYNVAGDGALGISEIADILEKPVIRFPVWVLKVALAIGSRLGITRYGPEQVRFLQYRPVLDNQRLKSEFGFTPEKTSLEAFQAWRKQAGL